MSKHGNEAGASVKQNSMRPVSTVKEEESDDDGDDDNDVLGQSMGSTTGLPVLRRRDTMLELSMTEVAHSAMRGARKLGPFERAVLVGLPTRPSRTPPPPSSSGLTTRADHLPPPPAPRPSLPPFPYNIPPPSHQNTGLIHGLRLSYLYIFIGAL